jgi:hypothetical protein
MPLVEILDGPPEWAGVTYESPEDMVADEIGLIHPRWRGTPVGISWGALYGYRKVQVAGDRHRYHYVGPFGARPHRLHDGVEDLTGWDVLVVQKELESEDQRKLWGSPVRVFAAPPGTPRPDPDRPPEGQGWQELTRGGMLRRPRAPGTGAFFQERLTDLMIEGDPWVVGHWRRLAEKHGPAKDAEVEHIEAEQAQMRRVAEAVRQLRRLQPNQVRSWTSAPPFPARTTWIPLDLNLDHRCDPASGAPAPHRPQVHRIRRPRPNSRAGPSWRRGTSCCPGYSTSRNTSCVSAHVVHRSATPSPTANAGPAAVAIHRCRTPDADRSDERDPPCRTLQ